MTNGQRNGRNGSRSHDRGRTQAEPGSLDDMERQVAALSRQLGEARAREGSQTSNAAGRNSSVARTHRGGNASGSSRSGSGFGQGGSRSRQASASSRGGRGGVSRNRQSHRPMRNAIAHVPEAERRDAINEHGQSRMVVVNTSLTGGDQNRFAAATYTGGAMGRTPVMQDLVDVAKGVKQGNGVSHVTFHIEPDYDDMHEFRQNSRVTERITASNGRIRPGRSANSGLVPDGRISLVSESRGKRCELCLSTTHGFAECVFAPKGFIVGCPMCNSRSHLVDECQQYKKLTMEEKVKLLITDRASFPALLSNEPWHTLLYHYLQREDSVVPAGFPWSEDFCREESCRDSCEASARTQEAYDETGDRSHLAFDTATENLTAIRNTYWQGNETSLPWTDRLAQLALADDKEVLPEAEDATGIVSRPPSPGSESTAALALRQNAATTGRYAKQDEGNKEDEIDYD